MTAPHGEQNPPPATETATPGQHAVTVRVRHGARPAAIRLPLRATLALIADPSPRQPWGPVVSSDPTVLRCASTTHPDGSVSASCTALRPGSATVHTTTAPLARGPRQHHWRLEVAVDPGP